MMMLLYLFILITTIGTQAYFTILAYTDVDFIKFIMINLKIEVDGNKEA